MQVSAPSAVLPRGRNSTRTMHFLATATRIRADALRTRFARAAAAPGGKAPVNSPLPIPHVAPRRPDE
jgi:hypothetical protein